MANDAAENDVALEKRAVRAAVRARIGAMPPSERWLASAAVCQRVMALGVFARARTVMLFAPLPDEVDLTGVLVRCREDGKRVCAARADWETREMVPAEVGGGDWSALVIGRFGVREPGAGAAVVNALEIDLVLVPGVAFDAGGHRLGRGGGFYDRFLARPELGRAALIGVGFGVQVVAKVPRSGHDRPVDAVITERGVIVRRAMG
jgi:5-formyltetrahydrofolate cyclo-ligase